MNLIKPEKHSIVIMLNPLLAELIKLGLVTKQAHWNIRGTNFIAIHSMCDDFYKVIIEHQDLIAERIVQLDGIALGTVDIIKNNTVLSDYPTNIYQINDHLQELHIRYKFICKNIRKLFIKIQDECTVDILTSILRDLEKFIWLIKSNITN